MNLIAEFSTEAGCVGPKLAHPSNRKGMEYEVMEIISRIKNKKSQIISARVLSINSFVNFL
jgi:hypothetical protein